MSKNKYTKQTYINQSFYLPQKAVKATLGDIFKIAKKELNKDPKDLDVLDIGCSKGEHTFELEKYVHSVVGVEPYKPSFLIAQKTKKRKKSKAFFYNKLIENYHAQKRFDLAISLATIEHMPNAKASFDNIFRLLKNGGMIYMTAPNKLWPLEPHYNLLFLNYLPLPLANLYLRITGKGTSFKDSSYSKTYFGMKAFLNQFSCKYYFYLPDPGSPYLGGTGPLYKYLYKIGIFLIFHIPLFWMVSKGFIVIIIKVGKSG